MEDAKNEFLLLSWNSYRMWLSIEGNTNNALKLAELIEVIACGAP